ncbi:LysM peptidoglycan-binding domain-containing protein [SAR92 clade bacterium H455]|uniref:LysM peptidoglycan-binding domain-containing protein n=1 Tax=SAR92 clade bacterium H455 TaxID=2974818 RepID=A0ABY5TQ35_9GAMM|nr:LysM peptidoglycan-binding domain-containing protein [SAR92 clade bacterium H455]
MKKFGFGTALFAAVLFTALVATLSFSNQSFSSPNILVNEDVPDSYTVVRGDTLWDISALFLKDPWMWPEIWHANQQIDNPHLIYPGDVISLVYINGVPQLKIIRSREVKLSPEIRSLDHSDAISALPLNVISTFLSKTRVTDDATLNGAPYVLGGAERRILVGMSDDFYARGDFTANRLNYGIYRRGEPYLDPETGELLGIRAIDIGAARIKALEKDIATLSVSRAEGEIRIKDRLLVVEERTLASTFYPRAPETAINGSVINVEEGVRNAGALDVVAINRGDRDGLQVGDTLAIFKRGDLVKDRVASERVRLPDERIGLLMVFDTYEKMSFALVMEADRQIDLGDLLRNP